MPGLVSADDQASGRWRVFGLPSESERVPRVGTCSEVGAVIVGVVLGEMLNARCGMEGLLCKLQGSGHRGEEARFGPKVRATSLLSQQRSRLAETAPKSVGVHVQSDQGGAK